MTDRRLLIAIATLIGLLAFGQACVVLTRALL